MLSRHCLETSLAFHGHSVDAVNRSQDLVGQLTIACLGAGVITSFAVAQGQDPITALGITVFSAVAAVMMGQLI